VVRLPIDTCGSPAQIFAAVATLPAPKLRTFNYLCGLVTQPDRVRTQIDHLATWLAMTDIQRNILGCRQSFLRDGCICEIAGLIEISYTPNCAGTWSGDLGVFTVHALHDIPAGTLIFMSHANVGLCSMYTQNWLVDRHLENGCICTQCLDQTYGTPFWETKRLTLDIERLLGEAAAMGENRDWERCWVLVEHLMKLQMKFGETWELGYA
jgi:hypothetical protein